ncbi:MAG: hypothetical protein P4L36_22600 [Holophaga sp.]|nr:hypothetical protein [Holophaga sp.]
MAQQADPLWSIAGYLQQGWPKNTNTNRQIHDDINTPFGTHFETWKDVPNVNLGILALRKVAPKWKVGLEGDWSSGSIGGTQTAQDFGYGPGSIYLKEKYQTYADLQVLVQMRPFGEEGRVVPFLSAAGGLAYDNDSTTIKFISSAGGGTTDLLRVTNHGFFPILNLGIGMDIFLSARRAWFVETQLAYTWARLSRNAPASGPGANGQPTVRDDTDDTGPNILLGIGRRF